MINRFIIIFGLVLAAFVVFEHQIARGQRQAEREFIVATDIYVVDGDTIRINGTSIRLDGIDAPETRNAKCDSELALGNRAKVVLRDELDEALKIEIRYAKGRDNAKTLDKYQRFIGTLYADGRDVGRTLVDQGLARNYQGGARELWC